uniref:Uncharacterized protein n=1 Tax=Glossina pallidipes TaxID=7398 RepID=A0A1A9ZCI0_GLOPL
MDKGRRSKHEVSTSRSSKKVTSSGRKIELKQRLLRYTKTPEVTYVAESSGLIYSAARFDILDTIQPYTISIVVLKSKEPVKRLQHTHLSKHIGNDLNIMTSKIKSDRETEKH